METWKSIAGYEGLYEVSNRGQVRSVVRTSKRNGNTTKTVQSTVLRIQQQSNGYLKVSLCKDGKARDFRVHRLVASAFIPNPDNLPEVNHLNEDKSDNRVENLCWSSHRDNIMHGTQLKRGVANRNQRGELNGMFGRKGALSPVAKRVIQSDSNGKVVAEYSSIREAAKAIGRTPGSITNAIVGRTSNCAGYTWKYSQI